NRAPLIFFSAKKFPSRQRQTAHMPQKSVAVSSRFGMSCSSSCSGDSSFTFTPLPSYTLQGSVLTAFAIRLTHAQTASSCIARSYFTASPLVASPPKKPRQNGADWALSSIDLPSHLSHHAIHFLPGYDDLIVDEVVEVVSRRRPIHSSPHRQAKC